MGLTKDYSRFVRSDKFNIITSVNCNISRVKFKDDDKFIRYIAAGGAEDVIIWDCKLAKKVSAIEGDKSECVCLASHWETDGLAAGYRNGTVELYKSSTGEHISTFSGHSSAVTSIAFDQDGHRIATGSMDTDVVVWDIVAEQGLFRLSGHKGLVTQVQFMKDYDVLVTSSKDTFIKFWDLRNGHCFKTLTGHVTEVWCFTLVKDDSYLVSGTNDSELRVWKIEGKPSEPNNPAEPITDESDDIEYFGPIKCTKLGSILRQGLGRVVSISTDQSSQILCCHGNEKLSELFYFLPDEEVIRRYNKKQKRMKKKLEQQSATDGTSSIPLPPPTSLTFCVSRLPAIKTQNRIKSTILSFEQMDQKIKLIASTNSNTLEVHSVDVFSKESKLEKIVTGPGHNSDVRCIAFDDADNSTIVSGSANSLKIWNRRTSRCLRTIDTEYVLSLCFVPNGRYVLAGMKSGSLIIADVASADIIETILAAHTKEIWRVSVLPNKIGCASCGGDSTIKIWNFEWSAGFLTLTHTRTLKLEESVLDVCVSPDSNLIATALLDCTAKVFFLESFKFFLNLYGHKLPVTCLDISHDSAILATGSADRNIKIWGLDYGDCHKSIFAHDDTVTSLRFVPNTHQFFTCSKDGSLKQWDADSFQRILTLPGHRGEARCLSISHDGFFVASVGQDRVIRLWEKSDEPLVLEDERETERQQEEEMTLATGADSVLYGRGAMSLASKKTVNSEKGVELLLECLQECEKLNGQVATSVPPIMQAFNASTPDTYLRAVLRKIRTSDLEEVLSLLPFSDASLLLRKLVPLLHGSPHQETEVVCRVMVFLLRAHHKPMVSSKILLPTLQKLQTLSSSTVHQMKDTVGYNLHALLAVQRQKELQENVKTFEELLHEANKNQSKKRKKQILSRTAMMKI